jgi:hypothetical protein
LLRTSMIYITGHEPLGTPVLNEELFSDAAAIWTR